MTEQADRATGEPEGRRRRSVADRFRAVGAYLVGMVVAAGVLCWSTALRGKVPFGPETRSTNDLGDQSAPVHAHLRDLLLDRADGDLLVNWHSGFGVPFLPDLYTYAASPFSALVLLFPRERIDLALFVVTAVKLAVAAAAMVALLRRLGPGPWWLSALLGAGYALCGWAVDDGAYVPQWLDGLILFPLLVLVGEVRRDGRRFLLGVLVVSYGWWANFYTAYMATLAAGLVVCCRLLVDTAPWRVRLLGLARFAGTVVCGILLVAPLLLPTFRAARQAAASTAVAEPFRPVPLDDFLSRLLPLTEGVGFSPGLYVGAVALLLVLALPWHTGVPARVRIGWAVLIVALVVSMRWTPTVAAWHGFDTPEGSSYRQAFVLCGVLVVAAWQAVAYGLPRWPALLAGAAGVAGIAALGTGGRFTHPSSVPVLAGSAVLAVGVLLGVRFLAARRGWLPTVAMGLLGLLALAASTAEEVTTAVVTDQRRDAIWYRMPAWGPEHDERRAAVTAASAFPDHRTEPGKPWITRNDPMLLGGQGAGYYSSLIPTVTYDTLRDLGFPVQNRVVLSGDNPVLDAIFGVRVRLRKPVEGLRIEYRPAPPLVTVRPSAWREPDGDSAMRRQDALLGTPVYRYPDPVLTINGRTVQQRSLDPTPVAVDSGDRVAIDIHCGPRQRVYLSTPDASGVFDRAGYPLVAGSAIRQLGRTGRDGRWDATFAPDAPGTLAGSWVACLDDPKLDALVAELTRTGARSVRVRGHRLDATLPAGSSGVAVLSVTRVDGWRCTSDGRNWSPPEDHGGLIGVPLVSGSTTVSCRLEPPGLRTGLVLGAVGVVLTLLGALVGLCLRLFEVRGWWVARRDRSGRSGVIPSPVPAGHPGPAAADEPSPTADAEPEPDGEVASVVEPDGEDDSGAVPEPRGRMAGQ